MAPLRLAVYRVVWRPFLRDRIGLRRPPPGAILRGMYVVTEADAAAIRTAYEAGGELIALVEFPLRFPGITDNAKGVSRRGSSLGGRRCRNAEHGAAKGKLDPAASGQPLGPS